MKQPAGTTWEKTIRGVIYLMQAQEKGKAKIIRRISPYVMPQRAKKGSALPKVENRANLPPKNALKRPIKKTGKIPFDYNAHNTHFPINLQKGVYIRENERTEPTMTVRKDSRTMIIKRLKD